ncbi:MAG: hypothetical protein IJ313_13295 [Clostridia bacterium]|nr:hypothetical protein [Clostridia bacterium]
MAKKHHSRRKVVRRTRAVSAAQRNMKASVQRSGLAWRIAIGVLLFAAGILVLLLFVNRPQYESINWLLILLSLVLCFGGGGYIAQERTGLLCGGAMGLVLAVALARPSSLRSAAILLGIAAAAAYFAYDEWKALPPQKKDKMRCALICCNVLGCMLCAYLLFTVTKQTVGQSVFLGILSIGAGYGYALLHPEWTTVRKGKAPLLFVKPDIMPAGICWVLLLRFLLDFNVEWMRYGQIALYAMAPFGVMGALFWRLYRRKPEAYGKTIRKTLLVLGVYAFVLIGYANAYLPQAQPAAMAAIVENLDRSVSGRGANRYHVSVRCGEEKLTFPISLWDYAQLEEGDALTVNRYSGALGIPFDKLVF